MLPSIFEITGCVTHFISNIAIISRFIADKSLLRTSIRYYGLRTPYDIEYSDLIAKFDFLGIYIQNYGIFTPSNIEYGEFFLLITI